MIAVQQRALTIVPVLLHVGCGIPAVDTSGDLTLSDFTLAPGFDWVADSAGVFVVHAERGSSPARWISEVERELVDEIQPRLQEVLGRRLTGDPVHVFLLGSRDDMRRLIGFGCQGQPPVKVCRSRSGRRARPGPARTGRRGSCSRASYLPGPRGEERQGVVVGSSHHPAGGPGVSTTPAALWRSPLRRGRSGPTRCSGRRRERARSASRSRHIEGPPGEQPVPPCRPPRREPETGPGWPARCRRGQGSPPQIRKERSPPTMAPKVFIIGSPMGSGAPPPRSSYETSEDPVTEVLWLRRYRSRCSPRLISFIRSRVHRGCLIGAPATPLSLIHGGGP